MTHRFTRDFKTTDTKMENLFESDAQNYLNRKSDQVQPYTSLEIVLNGLYF